ncbi:PAS domain-containing sensor histidine kinase [Luteibacter sp. dw_328]|uniref:hybrid sensor histidine kinase/response regulator n=1 Tax=Luteibacter sp. dw_328 TaxID=2719796 RepID=UPI001BD56B4C|nr:PAS domain-containing sensor histidine kinase [Luteibacter sp. dw_328]
MTPHPPFVPGDTDGLSWLDRGGEAGALIRAFDWTRTPLGALETWSQSLRTITAMLLLSPVPIVLLWGPQGIMIYNDAYSIFAGARHPRLLGSEVRKGWTEIADFNDNVMRVGLAGGTLAYKDQQLTLERNGKPEPVWMNLDYSPVLDESGMPGGVIAFVVETTARVRAEQNVREGERRFREHLEAMVAERTAALERSEANLRTIFETSHLYQYLLSPDGNVVYANATALAGVEATLDDVIGLPFWLTPWFGGTPGMPQAVEAATRRAAAGKSEHMSMALNLPTGVRSFDFSMRPVTDESGNVVAMVPEAVEKTARIKAEQTLLQVQKMEALGNLTGGIAHDFNNLLMAVQGSLDLLRERMPQEPLLLRLADTAIAGAERGSALTRRMLAFARRQDLTTESIDLRQLVEGMTELLRRSLGPTIVLETYFGPRVPTIRADANQLETALLNLAVNARDAMDGVGTLIITTDEDWMQEGHATLSPGHYVRLSVSDSGAGMDEAMLKRAIEPFFTTKGVGKGTGLGLSMVHGLSEQLGGTLILRSRVDEGTTAEIWLPAAQVHDLPASREAHVTPVLGRCAPDTVVSILTVDDDDLVRTTTVDMLEALGYQVIPARSGYEALQVLEATCVDLVITDHAMPQMTGTQLAERIRERWPDLPMIMATGYADLPAGQQLQIPRLAKPYSQATLADAVHRTVSRPR